MCASDDQNHSQTLWTKLRSASNSLCQSQLPQHIRTSKIAILTWSKRFNTSIKTMCLENRKCNQTTASITKRPAHASSPKARCLAAQRCLRRKKNTPITTIGHLHEQDPLGSGHLKHGECRCLPFRSAARQQVVVTELNGVAPACKN